MQSHHPLASILVQSPLQIGVPRYESLYADIRQSISNGRLSAGEKLPSSRALAKALAVSRNTVITALEMLQAEGFIYTKKGSGTFVSDNLSPALLGASNLTSSDSPTLTRLSKLGDSLNYAPKQAVGANLFANSTPAFSHFPKQAWLSCSRAALRQHDVYSQQHVFGNPLLRQQIAEHLRLSRGVNCQPEQVMITSGSQHGLYCAFRLLLNAGDKIILESCGYQGIDGALDTLGIQRHIVATDDAGIIIDGENAELSICKAMLLTPSRSFPLGSTLSLERRLQALHWARKHQGWVIEDDYDSEINFDASSIASLQGLDPDNKVIYCGTFSRTMFQNIRLGYLVLPKALIPAFHNYRQFSDGGLANQLQLAMAMFMQTGHFGRHLRRMRVLYQQRKGVLCNLIRASLPGLPVLSEGGSMHMVFGLDEFKLEQAICRSAAQKQLHIRPLSAYCREDATKKYGLVLGFSSMDEGQCQFAVSQLRILVEQLATVHTAAQKLLN